jgi:DUF1365 family protein
MTLQMKGISKSLDQFCTESRASEFYRSPWRDRAPMFQASVKGERRWLSEKHLLKKFLAEVKQGHRMSISQHRNDGFRLWEAELYWPMDPASIPGIVLC